MEAKADSIAERKIPGDFPLVLCIPLKHPHLDICMRPKLVFRITLEVSQQRIGVRVSRIPGRRVPAVAGAVGETQGSRPVAAGSLAVQHSFKIDAEFVVVIAAGIRQIVGKRGAHIIVSGLTPATEPVNEGRRASHAGEICNIRNGSQIIVFREKLRRCVSYCRPEHHVERDVIRYETFGIMSHAESELIYQAPIEHVNPVS